MTLNFKSGFRKCTSWLLVYDYDAPKIVHIECKRIGITFRIVQMSILFYIVGYALVWKKGYQETCPVVSAVTTKVKGVSYTDFEDSEIPENISLLYKRIWDPADYVIPSYGNENGGFFIMTNAIITPNQTRDVCSEDPNVKGSICTKDEDCIRGEYIRLGNGVMTGKCVQARWSSKGNVKTCEIRAWCPVELNELPLGGSSALLEDSKNFTVLIKNYIEFPKFGEQYKRRNILQNTNRFYLKNCIYDAVTDPFCPIFRLGNIVKAAGENYSHVAIKGAIFVIKIQWKCNLDNDFQKFCVPKYDFQRMDVANAKISPGWNFRTAQLHEENRRTLLKIYGIKFIVDVEGEAGKFSLLPLMINVGSGLAFLGLATALCDFLVIYAIAYNSCQQKRMRRKTDIFTSEVDGGRHILSSYRMKLPSQKRDQGSRPHYTIAPCENKRQMPPILP